MAADTKIEWCDSTFNPWIGCTRISPACDHCYAAVSTPARTLGVEWGPHAERRRTSDANWRVPLAWERKAGWFVQCATCGWRGETRVLAWPGKPTCMKCQSEDTSPARRRVFCASLADVFDNAVPQQWRDDLFGLISATPHIDWLILTKRIGNVGNMLPVPFDFGRIYPNVWLGITICSQEEANRDIPKLLELDARVRFLSIEPMLGPVYVEDIPDPTGGVCLKPLAGLRWVGDGNGRCTTRSLGGRIDWVICGGESGPQARPMHPEWARSIRDQCAAAGVPMLFKQWGEWLPISEQTDQFTRALYRSNRIARPGEDQANLDDCYGRTCKVDQSVIQADGTVLAPLEPMAFRQGAGSMLTFRVGKKAAGRLLDGVAHDAWPQSAEGAREVER